MLVGGSTRVRLVVRKLEETLPVNPLGFDKKDVAIALGAAHYANIRWSTKRRVTRPQPEAPPPDTKHLDQYLAAIEETYADEKLNKVEIDRLNAFARQLGLSREQTVEIERRVMGNSKEGILFQQYCRMVEMVWMDEKLNGLEAEWLGALAGEMGLNQQQTSYAETKIMGATRSLSTTSGARSSDFSTAGMRSFVRSSAATYAEKKSRRAFATYAGNTVLEPRNSRR